MYGVALIAHFEGDPDELASRFHTAASRYAETADAPQPTTAVLLRNRDGIAAVLVWPASASLQPFRTFLRGAIAELGLAHPRVEHLRADATTWQAIVQTGGGEEP
jgi:hypothetical protein